MNGRFVKLTWASLLVLLAIVASPVPGLAIVGVTSLLLLPKRDSFLADVRWLGDVVEGAMMNYGLGKVDGSGKCWYRVSGSLGGGAI